MSIQWFKKQKKILLPGILTAIILTQPLNAFSLKGKLNIGQNISNTINKYTNGKLGLLSSYLSNLIGAKINLKCLVPAINLSKNFNIGKFSPCNIKTIYQFHLGPCSATININNNPLYSRLNQMCQFLDTGISINGIMNVGFTDISINAGLRNNTDLKNIIFPNKITYQDIYGSKDGSTNGYFATVAKKYPNSADGKIFLTNNKELLILKTNLIKTTGTTDLSKTLLPKNIAQYNIMVNKNAKTYSQIVPSIIDIISNTQKILTSPQAMSYIKNSDGTYNYNNYLNYFVKYVNGNLDGDKTIIKLYKNIDSAIDYKYAQKLLILKAESKYFEYAPTQSRLNLISIKNKNNFLYKSTIWSAQETNLLGQREEERAKAHQVVRIALRKAYIASMPFDKVAAQKELDAILQ